MRLQGPERPRLRELTTELTISTTSLSCSLTYISTEAIRLIMSQEGRQLARDPSIMAEAAFAMLSKSVDYTGNFEIDEILLRREAGYDSKKLAEFGQVPFEKLQEDLYIPQWVRDKVRSLRDADPTSPGT